MTDSTPATDGHTVGVHYRGTLDDGTEFDASAGRDPLSFQVGSGQVIAGFDDAVRGLTVGETRSVRIPPEQAYGERDDSMVLGVPTEHAPDGLEVGDRVRLGETPAVVVGFTEDAVVVDANHPLAGEALNFELTLVSIA